MVVAEVVEVVEVESSGSGDVRALVLSRRTNPPYVAPRDFRPSAPKSRSQIISSSQPEGGKRGCAPRSASRLEEAIRTTWFFLISREMKYTGTEIQGQGIPSSPSFPSCRQRASAASRVRGDRGEGFLGSWMGGGGGWILVCGIYTGHAGYYDIHSTNSPTSISTGEIRNIHSTEDAKNIPRIGHVHQNHNNPI